MNHQIPKEQFPDPPKIIYESQGNDAKVIYAYGVDHDIRAQGYIVYLWKKDYIMDDINNNYSTYVYFPFGPRSDLAKSLYDHLSFICGDGPEPSMPFGWVR